MVEFITLLLGLVSGVQAIEVSVTEDVARVELRLDGAIVETLEGEPWRAEVDLGAGLRPHVLAAVAFDDAGEQIHRAEQILNVSESRAVLRVILGRPRDDGTRDGRLVWMSADNAKPKRVAVTLDGEPLEVVARRAFKLPFTELESEQVHMIHAQADFPGGVLANATVLLGGAYGEQVTSQLTAVPVLLDPGTALPPPERMAGWLTKNGEPLEIMTVEERGAEVVVVRDKHALGPLRGLAYRFREQRHRQIGKLGPGQSIRLLEATPRRQRIGDTEDEREVFRLSEPLSEGYGGVPWILGTKSFRRPAPDDAEPAEGGEEEPPGKGEVTKPPRDFYQGRPQRLADAVASAGLTAAASGWLRTVVLVLGEESEDESQRPAAEVRAYLRTLRVPFRVWSTTSDARRAEQGGASGWEPIEDISNRPKYLQAAGRLAKSLEHQRVLWIRGQHFVHDVRLAPHVKGLRLAE